ncbi:MAG: preprotein translocase subunit YajC [Myxococcales bacterium]|nr:preprotein translocase subunit YajC [Myxococcales bacterium]
MLYTVLHTLVVLQSGIQGEGSAPAAPSGGGPADAQAQGSPFVSFALMGLMFAVFYFLVLRPQRTRQKEHEELLKALRKGDVVRTNGGVRGEIFDINERDATLLIADKVKINILRSHIAGREADPSQKAGDAKG